MYYVYMFIMAMVMCFGTMAVVFGYGYLEEKLGKSRRENRIKKEGLKMAKRFGFNSFEDYEKEMCRRMGL